MRREDLPVGAAFARRAGMCGRSPLPFGRSPFIRGSMQLFLRTGGEGVVGRTPPQGVETGNSPCSYFTSPLTGEVGVGVNNVPLTESEMLISILG